MALCRGCSLFVGTLAVALSALSVCAHQCDDGRRVSCMVTKPLLSDAAPSATYGYGAHGYPMCTPEGSKVFCLVNHDYHRCATGMAPCCEDGSNPSHGHYGRHGGHQDDRDTGDSPTCSDATATSTAATTATTTATTITAAASHDTQMPIILDDMDRTLLTEENHVFEGTYWPCLRDAYKGQFHHDWSLNKGGASFTFVFDPPASGCYKVEEYHPGQDQSCSSYLPTNAIVDVDNGQEPLTTLTINQAVNPAQWNSIGTFTFVTGTLGRITMRNSKSEKCRAFQCFMMADAFRLTRVADNCSHVDDAQDGEQDFTVVPAEYIAQPESNETEDNTTHNVAPEEETRQENNAEDEEDEAGEPEIFDEEEFEQDQEEDDSAGQLEQSSAPEHDDAEVVVVAPQSRDARGGRLFLRVAATHGHHDLHATLVRHRAAIEVTLATHMGYESVDIFDIVAKGRRLGAGNGPERFKASFIAKNFVGNFQPGELTELLSVAFASLGTPLEFLAARVEWNASSARGNLQGLQVVIIALSAAVVGLGTVVVSLYTLFVCSTTRCKKKHAADSPASQVTPSELDEADVEKPRITKGDVKAQEKAETDQSVWETASNSTQEPASEDAKSVMSLPQVNENVDDETKEKESRMAI